MQSQHASTSRSTGQPASSTDGRPPAIAATDVHVTYADGTEAVSGIDLAVDPGECFGFLSLTGAEPDDDPASDARSQPAYEPEEVDR